MGNAQANGGHSDPHPTEDVYYLDVLQATTPLHRPRTAGSRHTSQRRHRSAPQRAVQVVSRDKPRPVQTSQLSASAEDSLSNVSLGADMAETYGLDMFLPPVSQEPQMIITPDSNMAATPTSSSSSHARSPQLQRTKQATLTQPLTTLPPRTPAQDAARRTRVADTPVQPVPTHNPDLCALPAMARPHRHSATAPTPRPAEHVNTSQRAPSRPASVSPPTDDRASPLLLDPSPAGKVSGWRSSRATFPQVPPSTTAPARADGVRSPHFRPPGPPKRGWPSKSPDIWQDKTGQQLALKHVAATINLSTAPAPSILIKSPRPSGLLERSSLPSSPFGTSAAQRYSSKRVQGPPTSPPHQEFQDISVFEERWAAEHAKTPRSRHRSSALPREAASPAVTPNLSRRTFPPTSAPSPDEVPMQPSTPRSSPKLLSPLLPPLLPQRKVPNSVAARAPDRRSSVPTHIAVPPLSMPSCYRRHTIPSSASSSQHDTSDGGTYMIPLLSSDVSAAAETPAPTTEPPQPSAQEIPLTAAPRPPAMPGLSEVAMSYARTSAYQLSGCAPLGHNGPIW